MKSTQAMRDRCRELSKPNQDDYDRAVICILDDFEALQTRIEALEAALRKIASGENSFFGMMHIARAALDKDAGK